MISNYSKTNFYAPECNSIVHSKNVWTVQSCPIWEWKTNHLGRRLPSMEVHLIDAKYRRAILCWFSGNVSVHSQTTFYLHCVRHPIRSFDYLEYSLHCKRVPFGIPNAIDINAYDLAIVFKMIAAMVLKRTYLGIKRFNGEAAIGLQENISVCSTGT